MASFRVYVPSAESRILWGDAWHWRGNWITWAVEESLEAAEAIAERLRLGADEIGRIASGPLRGMQAAVVRAEGDEMPWTFMR